MEKSDSVSSPALESSEKRPATPLRCFTGALTAGTFSLLAYRLTLSIATSFANKPVTSSNPAVVNISAAVRTLVTGIVALGAGVFGIAALGLAALGIQLLFKGAKGSQTLTEKAASEDSD
ncbi:MAG: DUF3082 domain-containing protein [Cyanobacteria bacterium P01_A01_bin.116]